MARIITGLLLLLVVAAASAETEVERLLARETAPTGVVIEILEEDETALVWALPEVERLAQQLRSRFPELPIAVVTHGLEQFGLLTIEASEPFGSVHGLARSLTTGSEVDLHLCGAHAGWYGRDGDDFPDFVDVTPSAPALLNDYRALGYEVVRLEPPSDP